MVNVSCQLYRLPPHLNASIKQSRGRLRVLLHRVAILIPKTEDPNPALAARVRVKAAKLAEEAMIKAETHSHVNGKDLTLSTLGWGFFGVNGGRIVAP